MATEEVTDQIQAIFDDIDQNCNGRISTQELNTLFQKMGIKLSLNDVRRLVYQYDKDGSQDIDIEEFRALIADVLEANKTYMEAYEIFTMFDANSDRLISREEVKDACKQLPRKLTDEEFEEFIKKLDADGNGVVDFDEFLKVYAVGV